MKQILSVEENLELLFSYIITNFEANENAKNAKINFKLDDGGRPLLYGLRENQGELELVHGEVENADLTLECSVTDWLKLCSDRIHPILGAIAGKLKFTGNTNLFAAVMNRYTKKPNQIEDKPKPYEFPRKRVWRKPGNVLILSGSPRGINGYTHFLLDKLTEGIKEAGSACKTVILNKKNIKRCTGCWHCWTITNGECILKDDMKELKQDILNADLIVYGFPIYFDGIPALVKNFMDRQTQLVYPFLIKGIYKTRHPRRQQKEQYLMTLLTCGFIEEETFDPAKENIEQMCHNSHYGFLGHISVSGTAQLFKDPTVQDILHEKVECVKEAGRQIVNRGKIDKKVLKKISGFPKGAGYVEEFRKLSDFAWQKLLDEKSNDY